MSARESVRRQNIFSVALSLYVLTQRGMPITHPVESVLTILDKLGAEVPSDLNVNQTIEKWFKLFKNFCESGDVKNLSDIILEDAYWHDVFALTWSFCTFEGTPIIKRFLEDCLALVEVRNLKLKDPSYAQLQRPYPDLAWIQALSEFETNVGLCSGVV